MKKFQNRIMTDKELKAVSGGTGCHGIVMSGTIILRTTPYPDANTRKECKQIACSIGTINNMYIWGLKSGKCGTIKSHTNLFDRKDQVDGFGVPHDFIILDGMSQ